MTILADYGTRYQSKLFNPEFLRSKNLPVPGWMEREPEIAGALRAGGLMAETEALFRDDAYLRETEATRACASTSAAASCSTARSSMRPPAASPAIPAHLARADGSAHRDCRHGHRREQGRRSSTFRRAGAALPAPGEALRLAIDWERRHRLMRMHTACHLLTVVCPFPITGAAVAEDDRRVDFDIPEAGFTKEDVTRALMELVAANHPVFTRWITDEELAANPGLVKSKNVRPPAGTGRIRLVCIGDNAAIDSQPCGGTHVRRPARSARSISARSRRRAARTAASASASGRCRRSSGLTQSYRRVCSTS